MIAVPLAGPFGIAPAEQALNRSSSCACDIFSSCVASYAIVLSFLQSVALTGPPSSRCVLQHRLGGLFGGDVDGADDEDAGDPRKHRRIDDAQPAGAVHREAADDAAALGRAARAAARRVVAPG